MWVLLLLLLLFNAPVVYSHPISDAEGSNFLSNLSVPNRLFTHQELREIFLGQVAHWAETGTPIVLVLPAHTSMSFRQLANQELCMSSSQYLEHIRKNKIKISWVDTDTLVLLRVSNTRGSIGYYMDSSMLMDTGYMIRRIIYLD